MTSELLLPLGGLSLHHILLSFAGGIFGAAIGALPAFILCGLFTIAGCAVMAAGGGGDFLINLGFGCTFGPHVSFAGGVAAAAYAARIKQLPGGGKDITTALMGIKRPDVLLVGGVFGVLGTVLAWLFLTVMPYQLNGMHWTDGVALAVAVSAIITRVLFGNGVFGKVAEGRRRFKLTEDDPQWLPWQATLPEHAVIGLGAGLLSSYLALLLGAEGGGGAIGFGISGLSLIFLQYGTKVPVTHHITLVAAVAALASGSVVWGGLIGVATALASQYLACLFHVHGDTHIDPPAVTIACMTTVVVALAASGLFSMMPLP